ncbi:cyclic nucleotide-binding domain-containing protein [Falsiroseomonas oryzae]|uniref:cyclic nucleotide-binding domain-containing protein n=1 Tax=Falsiroseomonas oryzae TaxID=2766473 RepID=UPI0022EB8AC1|nr:cyclic nucleotide-binding domain-containing protein [Roseomonas sp. MO-31]
MDAIPERRVGQEGVLARLGRTAAGGAIAAVWSVTALVAYAALVFSGPAAAALPVGTSGFLLGFAVLSVVVAFCSSTPGIAVAAFGSSAVVQAAVAQTTVALLEAKGVPEGSARAGALVLSCGAVTIGVGVLLCAGGLLRIGSLVRLLPHPVSSGFFCGLGAAFVLGAVRLASGVAPGPGNLGALLDPDTLLRLAVCAGIGLLLVLVPRRVRHWAVMPGILLAAVLAYHAVRLAIGQSMTDAQAARWLLGPFGEAGPVTLPSAASFALLDAELLLALLPFVGTATLLAAITLALMAAGIESTTGRPMDIDREMALAGAANVATGAVGGIPGGHALAATGLLSLFGAGSRAAAAVPGLIAVGVLALGPTLLGVLPRPILAALLLSQGIEWMVLRTWRDVQPLPRHEAAILLAVAVTMASIGLVEGLALGLALALLIFVWTYRQVPVIRSVLRGDEMRSSVTRPGRALRVLEREGQGIVLVRLQGYMFFLNALAVQTVFAARVAQGARVVVLDFDHVLGMDSSAIDAFRRLEQQAVKGRVRLVLCAVPPALSERFARHGVFCSLAWSHAASADRGLEKAEEAILAMHGEPPADGRIGFADFIASIGDLPDVARRLEPFVERVEYGARHVLMRQGDAADDMVFLERGRVAAVLDEGQKAVHLRTLTAGTLVGEIALFRGGARTATVIAETPCEAVRLTRAAIERLHADDPALAFVVQRAIMLQLADKLADNTRAVDLALR